MPVCAKEFDLPHEELRIKVGGEVQVFFARGHPNDVGDMRLIYSVLCHSHHIKAEAKRLLGLVPHLTGASKCFCGMHIVVEDLQEKGVLGFPQNMLERGGLPSGLHANESHHAILAKTSVDG